MSPPLPSPTPAAQQGGRLRALDVMRGATILAMILVNNPGTWGAMYWPLAHAQWHGWTPTDLVFPFFLFMVGVAMAYAFRKYEDGAVVGAAVWLRIGRRVAMLVLLGLLLNCFGRLIDFALGRADGLHLDTLRLPGVLQRIGLAYGGASLIVLLLGPRSRVAAGVGLLLGYAALLFFMPVSTPLSERLTPEGNVVRVVDLAVIGQRHMYTQATSEPTDPEGLLSTVPSIVTVLIGYGVGCLLRRRAIDGPTLVRLALVGALLTAAGLVWGAVSPEAGGMPINKKLWTSSFVLLTGGLGTLTLTAILAVFDWLGAQSAALRRVAGAFEVVGVNAITAFVLASMTANLLGRLRVGETTLYTWLYESLFVAALGPGELASLAFALTVVAFWWLMMGLLWRAGLVFRV
ncbi:hypothetical protein Pla175_19010 [Pirellulimonas nuda]|uniref:Uncharacterized protein n=1 Tax=Pirellulimonas nuda TaxID=2528009 RepID=A0A518DAP7_9BACT|nr:DUF5009 domain-containing protein [Pirellulimonas nuda]QDU88523.1 hypothetical protein Pla175_19010 [Pirellulimonas nuda]